MSRLARILLIVIAVLMVCPEAYAQRRKGRTRKPPRTERTTKRNSGRKSQAPARSMDNLRREQSSTQQQISATSTQIKNNDIELSRQMGRLDALNADIATSTRRVEDLRTRVDSLGGAIRTTSDSISILEGQLEQLRAAYADAMAKIQPSARSLDSFTFIFSARSFSEAWSRLRYLRRFSMWREAKARAITDAIDRIAEQRSNLTLLRHSQDMARREAERAGRQLKDQQDESRRMVAQLRKEDSRLRAQLREYRRRSAALDSELNRLIAAEQRRIEEEERRQREEEQRRQRQSRTNTARTTGRRGSGKTGSGSGSQASGQTQKPQGQPQRQSQGPELAAASTRASDLTGSFASNKGRLLFPVAGKYRVIRRFGSQPHPTLPNMKIDNSGIDIQASPSTPTRAVFGGTVSAIFNQPGFDYIVMLRHGKYLTVYAGLRDVGVKVGQTVKAGQTIGRMATEVLHFEVRNEKQKLNPSAWVK